jgi:ADP-heptose:LPS heptosyltransferase
VSRFPGRCFLAWHALRSSVATAGRRRPPDEPRRILIAHHLLLGDTLMLTPLVAKIAALHPAAEIVMAVPEPFAPLYEGRPYGVRALAWSPHRPARSALFRGRGYDLAFVPGDNRYAWLARALDARWIVAFAGDRPAYKSWPVDRLEPYPDRPATWGDMVATLLPGPPPAPFRCREWPAPSAQPFDAPRGRYAVLHLGASSALKLWPDARWRELADALAARGLEVVWSGGPGEDALVERCDPGKRFRSFAGTLSLAQLWHLLAGADLLVCPDTGIAHLGRIVGVPTATLFGPGSAALCGAGDFWAGAPYLALSVDPFECRDQRVLFKREIAWVRRCGRSTRECAEPRCMHAIDVARVVTAVDRLLESGRPGPAPG